MRGKFIMLSDALLGGGPDAAQLLMKGALVFDVSGHVLTHNNGYYVCSERMKGKCADDTERTFEIKKFEATIERFADSLAISELEGIDIFHKLSKDSLDWQHETTIEAANIKERMQLTLDCMKQDIKKTGDFKPGDHFDLKKVYARLLRCGFQSELWQDALATIKYLSHPAHKKIRVRWFCGQVKKFFISNTGRLVAIEFEGMGDYIFQYVEQKFPGYSQCYKVQIRNRIKFPSLDFTKAMNSFKEMNFSGVYSWSEFASENALESHINNIFSGLKDGEPVEYVRAWEFLIKNWWRTEMHGHLRFVTEKQKNEMLKNKNYVGR